MRTRAESCSSVSGHASAHSPSVVRYNTGHVPSYRTCLFWFLPVARCPSSSALLLRQGRARAPPHRCCPSGTCELQTGKCQPHQKRALADPRCSLLIQPPSCFCSLSGRPQNELVIVSPLTAASSMRTSVSHDSPTQGSRHWQDCASVQRRNADTQHSELR